MNTGWKCIAAFALMLLVATPAIPQSSMSFCDLLRNPERYNKKVVKVRATWIYGYEWTYLHCLGCDGRVWLDTSQIDEHTEKVLKHAPKGAGIVNVDAEGVFQTGDSYGHMNGYKYQLKVHTISNLSVISKGMKEAKRERDIEQKSACGGTNPR